MKRSSVLALCLVMVVGGRLALARDALGASPKRGGTLTVVHGVELTRLRQRDMDRYRRKLQIIFQDPYASLNPRITVGDAIGEPLVAHGLATRRAARER